MKQSGKIDRVFTSEDLKYFRKYFENLNQRKIVNGGNSFTGVSPDHQLYSWFEKRIFSCILPFIDPCRVLFASYLNEVDPWVVHSDYYHKLHGEPYLALLIPLTVDHGDQATNKTHTVIFNEQDTYVSTRNKDKIWEPIEWLNNRTIKNPNAVEYYKDYLSHLDIEELEYLTVQNVLSWELGSVLFWDERQLHCSDNFLKQGLKSKQALVIHTYI
jgi:hypothetical protein